MAPSLRSASKRAADDAVGTSKQPKKAPDTKVFQLFNDARIKELIEKENARNMKAAKAIQRATEAGAEPPTEEPPTEEELAELKERERLEEDGFSSWTKQEYTKFLRGSEKFGRSALQQIAEEVGTKTLEEVTAYSKAFYEKGPTLIQDFDKQEKKIEEGERKIAEHAKATDDKEEDDDEDMDDEEYFARINAFQNSDHFELVKVVAKAVGAEDFGSWNYPDVWEGLETPDGGWEAEVLRMLKQGYYPEGMIDFSEDQWTPLHLAVKHDNESVCRMLLAHNADVNRDTSFGDTGGEIPLHDVKSESICKLLLEAGSNVDELANCGNTPLMMAALRGNKPIVAMLIDAGADPTIYCTDGLMGPMLGLAEGETAAKTARRCGHKAVAKMLDAAERAHPKSWMEPEAKQVVYSSAAMQKEVLDNRARLLRIVKAYPPPSV